MLLIFLFLFFFFLFFFPKNKKKKKKEKKDLSWQTFFFKKRFNLNTRTRKTIVNYYALYPFCYWRIMLLFFLFFLNRRIKFVPNVKLCLMILRSRKRNFVPRFIRHYYHLLMDCYRYLTRVTYKYIMTNAKDYRITQLMWLRCWIFLMCNFFKQLVWNISYIEFFAYMYIILIFCVTWMINIW